MSHAESLLNPSYPRKPANIYYALPYFGHVLCTYVFLGSFALAWVADYLTLAGKTCMWIGFVTTCALAIAIHPTITTEKTGLDEKGNPIKARRPLVGFKRWEFILDLEGIENALYDDLHDDGHTDPRIQDGYRYTYAWIRI
jgi:hypothetical protein